MKKINYISRILVCSCFVAIAGCLFSCSDDDEKVNIEKIYIQSLTDTETEISKIRLGGVIRIHGSGLSTTREIYCNGKKVVGVNSNYITDNVIIFTIPTSVPTGSEVEREEDRNTIRIVTRYDDYRFPFTIMASAPSIASVSHTMARPGERIRIYGTALKDIERVTFPGGIQATNFQSNDTYTELSVVVPEGIGDNQGEICIEGPNGGAYTHSYINCKSGLFITGFSSGVNPAYAWGDSNISSPLTASLPAAGIGDGPKNPDTYRTIPKDEPVTFTGDKTIGGFNFYLNKAIESALAANPDWENLPCTQVAIQCDFYMVSPWTSGSFRLVLNNGSTGNNDTRLHPFPWWENGNVVPISFTEGWRTYTWILGYMKACTEQTLGELKTSITGTTSKLYWLWGSFQDTGGNWVYGTAMDKVQISFGNFRIVPYIKKSYSNE